MKGGEQIVRAKAYLCESVLVQNFLLELHALQWGYAASAVTTGGPEEGTVSKGPGRKTPGDGISACRLRQLPPLGEAPGRSP